MPFIRLSDDYNDHPKINTLSDGAFRLWHQGLGFCRKFQTDGFIPMSSLRQFKAYSPKRTRELMTPWNTDANPLWNDRPGFGVVMHDYLDWNLSKEEENQQRAESKQRMALGRDTELRSQLRLRDGGKCRYCGGLVSWTDRRGTKGATYDHIDPNGSSTIENLVIACRGCNSRKGSRTPEQAGMVLLPPLVELDVRADLNRIQKQPDVSLDISGKGTERESLPSVLSERKPLGKPPSSLEPEDIAERAGQLVERYGDLYAEHRRGARLKGRPALDWTEACDLVKVWSDKRLEKLAILVLTTDDPFIASTDRSFKIFAMKASWADDRLTQWEHEHGHQVTA